MGSPDCEKNYPLATGRVGGLYSRRSIVFSDSTHLSRLKESTMTDTPKKMVFASMAVAVLVAVAAVCDMVIGIPFGGSDHTFLMDILFIVSAAIVGYLAWDSMKEMR